MTTELAKFDEVAAAIAEYKAENVNLVFDYESAKGEKDARSHIYKLRQAKTKIAEIHKDAKADILLAGRALDGKKNELTGEVEEMIEVHDKPLREKKDRVIHEAFLKSEEIRIAREKEEADRLEAIRIREEEVTAKEEALRKAEQEQKEKELAAFRAKEAEIAAKEKELADKQAAINAEADAQRRETSARLAAIADAEQDKADALAKAEQDKQDAIDAERATVQREADEKAAVASREAAIEAARQADQTHRDEIESVAIDALTEITGDIDLSTNIVFQISEGTVPNIIINY